MTWIFLTIFAAFMQSWRNALQSKLSATVSVAGVTLARFIVASPIAALYLLALYQYQDAAFPDFNLAFISYIVGASIVQIVATGLMVKLFKMNNFAVGAGLAKSEALMAAILGVMFFGSALSLLGWIGVFIGAIAVLLLSGIANVKHFNLGTALLGLACGTSFALSSSWIREASLNSGLTFPHSAAWVLLLIISLQTLMLCVYIAFKERDTFKKMWHHKGTTTAVSVCSCLGSIGWFSAMSLQHVAYVKTLGQVEVFFTIMVSILWLKQPLKRQDTAGLLLIALAAILVMLPS
ncbi:MAG: multidrug transporter [Pseudoalteromonas sp.]|uniref:DMT family transporter n=1 Tax=unclassified Pseudoalteromonas TaxID=194690 RepID=UPI000C912901|nr:MULTISPECIES: DMT family transporter [unclassified Pseudoalteromonas]MAD02570.1 multidrug transporter [Pseudoalteromonas sp.]QLE07990.1 multidrug transporter [Pseudoalteromonas shioyasakiensis]URQ90516.1 multidrug transporter [Pseudoalteromonas sp. SCSIO 43101]|tara:strand:+ start:35133 stop:36011 length:879 start_codon:yes stop_codon:yes gene_type:complete